MTGIVTGGGGVDGLSLKIWDKATNVVVYDNVFGAPEDVDVASPQALPRAAS